MTRRYLWGIIVLLLITNLTTVAVWNNEKDVGVDEDLDITVEKDSPVATIGKQEIEYDAWMRTLKTEYGREVLKEMIDKAVVFELAEEKEIEINQKLIDRELALLYTMQGVLSETEIEERKTEWTEEIKYRLYLEELLTESISVSDQAIQEYYADHEGQYEFIESFQFSHAVLNDEATAERFLEELDQGASFSTLAREFSVDEETRDDGGYLGYYTDNSDYIPAEYFDVAKQLQENSVSDPIYVGNNVAILYVHRVIPDVSFSFDELKPHLRRELALEQIDEIISADPLWNKLQVDWLYD
ncbi:peptidyl-prolyl cis-trans isomerase [Aquibacillus koreensis]|uniref:peptidylprolyl isomerase n=1 Tax=Aquibacillus koreensis TaxID=279446 RepID=A0A9X3WME4_9BACI|nr:peptidyl-prolyl cis-trans isomerase [Aquibacillus koreensis]MCT2535299.1 peptidyl-prolyl cis-trans isomerase [Aquibacillus koreensis]MDC3422360.1 peptidyl-prolyl cis-trans isomerase [Aquibacillus koreensis]